MVKEGGRDKNKPEHKGMAFPLRFKFYFAS